MAKLTPEQKALNKEATKLRDKAFRERSNAYDKELDAVKKQIKDGPLMKAAHDADVAFNGAIDARNKAEDEIKAQIRELQRKLDQTRIAHEPIIAAAKTVRTNAWDAKHKAENAAIATVDAKYPDMVRRYSPAAWKSFEEFLPLVGKA